MKKLDFFILKSFFGPFVMTFFITVFILVMQFLWLYIDDLVGKGLSFWVIMEFLGWGSATILPLSMPLATLLASIMTFGNLGENNELLAMKAAGISLQRIFYPLIYVAALISVAAFFVSNDLIPLAYNKIYTLQYDIARTKDEIKIPTGTFYNGIDGYSVRIDSRHPESDMMYNVLVYNHTDNKGNISLAMADSGLIRSTPDKKSLVFTLFDGVSYEETNKVTARDTSLSLQKVDFKMQEVIIPLENYAFQKSDEDRYGNDIMAKDLKQLRYDRDSIGGKYAEVSVKQRQSLPYKLDIKRAEQLDTSKNKGFVSDFPIDTLEEVRYTRNELNAVEGAIGAVQYAIQSMRAYDRESLQYTFYLRRIDIEYLRKFTLSLACFLFFFIGAPLGAIIRKGGLGTPVIVSSLFFVLYWVVDISGKKLARDGVISPAMGAFVSTIFLFPIGAFLTWKSTKDSSIFNIETYIMPVKNFFKRFSGRKRHVESTDGSLNRRASTPVVFMGTPEFAVASLRALVEGGYNIAGVVTVPDRKSGRGQKLSYSPVKEYVLSLASEDGELPFPLLQPESLRDKDFASQLSALGGEIFVVVAFRMLPREIWSMPEKGTFNLHASLLPRYRGAAPVNWAIINGEKETGVTTFLIDDNIDTGSILFSNKVPVDDSDNAGTLHDKLMAAGSRLVMKTVDALCDGTVEGVPQEKIEGLSGTVQYAPKLTKEICRIDWNMPASEIHNLIRGLSPYPGAYSVLKCGDTGIQVKIFASAVTDTEYGSVPGEIHTDGKTVLSVRCARQSLSILELQLPGKKRLPVKDFLAGWRATDAVFE